MAVPVISSPFSKVTKMSALYVLLFVGLAAVSQAENLDKVQDIFNNLVSGHYYDEMPEANDLLPQEDGDIILPRTVLRDEEHLPYNPVWGQRLVSGGAGEGDQYLSPEGKIHNVHQVKTDSMLPSYCDPPNPCPEGFTAADGCLENSPNTAEFSRDYQVQQNCPCDPEHMFDCSNPNSNANQVPVDGVHREVRAKKGAAFQNTLNQRHPRSVDKHNPYLEGQKLRTVAKKSPGHLKAPQV